MERVLLQAQVRKEVHVFLHVSNYVLCKRLVSDGVALRVRALVQHALQRMWFSERQLELASASNRRVVASKIDGRA